MNELKAHNINDLSLHDIANCEFYIKSEADKVIAELKSKLDIYKRGFKEDDKTIAYLYAELCHNKYKRCLAMAKWCEMSARENDTRMCLPDKCKFTKHEEYLYFVGYYHKWHKRWLELANKFKEV